MESPRVQNMILSGLDLEFYIATYADGLIPAATDGKQASGLQVR